MLRGPAYIVLGWLLIAVVGGFADVLSLTVMLPATSAVVITHVAFARDVSLPLGLAVSIALGYLEDLHQGAPTGVLCLAHALSFLGLRWIAGRVHLGGWVLRSFAALVSVVMVDLLTFGILMALSQALGARQAALVDALQAAQWHVLATVLAAPPVWALIDRVFSALGIDEEHPASSWSPK